MGISVVKGVIGRAKPEFKRLIGQGIGFGFVILIMVSRYIVPWNTHSFHRFHIGNVQVEVIPHQVAQADSEGNPLYSCQFTDDAPVKEVHFLTRQWLGIAQHKGCELRCHRGGDQSEINRPRQGACGRNPRIFGSRRRTDGFVPVIKNRQVVFVQRHGIISGLDDKNDVVIAHRKGVFPLAARQHHRRAVGNGYAGNSLFTPLFLSVFVQILINCAVGEVLGDGAEGQRQD